jgi:hypothetical protein
VSAATYVEIGIRWKTALQDGIWHWTGYVHIHTRIKQKTRILGETVLTTPREDTDTKHTLQEDGTQTYRLVHVDDEGVLVNFFFFTGMCLL